MNNFEDRLRELMPELEKKMSYNMNKLHGKKTYMLDQIKKARKENNYPRLIWSCNTSLGGINFTLLYLIVGYSIMDGAHLMCIPMAKDIKRHLFTVISASQFTLEENEIGDIIKAEKIEARTTKFSHHYLERFDDRNHRDVVRFGSIEVAVLCDLFSSVDEKARTTNTFKDPRSLAKRCKKEDLDKFLELISELSRRNVDSILKYINFEEGISVIRTKSGYGIYKISDHGQTMITYIADYMIGEKQKTIFKMLDVE